ncbi:hypothetical protein HDU96_009506 [Phlyctochytrium bullatum]|nr:hypothetical protein HDU96_009506 [Phlyctochytrium bullatum]
MPSSPIVAVAVSAGASLLAGAATGLGATMCLLPWYNFYGPNIPGFILLRERGIFKECITTNLNLTTNFPISKTANLTCDSTTGTPCSAYVNDTRRMEACYNQTKGGYMSVGTTLMAGFALLTFIATIIFITRVRNSPKFANRRVYNIYTVTLLSFASTFALLSGIFALLGRYFMTLVVDYADFYRQQLSASSKLNFAPVTTRSAFSTSLAAAILAIIAALAFPLAIRFWAAYIQQVSADAEAQVEEEKEAAAVEVVEAKTADKAAEAEQTKA